MLKFLKDTVSIGSSAFSMGKVLLIAGGLLAATNAINFGVTALIFFNKGYQQHVNETAAAAVLKAEQHSRFLVRTAVDNGLLESEDAAAELTNEQLEGAIRHELSKGTNRIECLPAAFLQQLERLR